MFIAGFSPAYAALFYSPVNPAFGFEGGVSVTPSGIGTSLMSPISEASIFQGDANKIIRVSSGGFDLSDATNIEVVFCPPEGKVGQFTRDFVTRVTLGSGDLTDSILGFLSSGEYVEYVTDAADFSTPGAWTVYMRKLNTNLTPNLVLHGAKSTLQVLDPSC